MKIAVVDTQINPDLPDFQGADLTVAEGSACVGKDPSTSVASAGAQHGSTVTAMLIGNGTGVAGTKGIVPDASVTFYGVGATADCDPLPEVAESKITPIMWMVKRALDDGADIVSVSMVTGDGNIPDDRVLAEAVARKVPVVAGNPNDVFKEGAFPAALNSVIGVSAVDSDQKLPIAALGVENAVAGTTVVAPGVNIATIGDGSDPGSWDVSGRATGTSLATPLVAGILAAAKQKYPDATGNQLIQSLVRNTGAEDHEVQYSDTGGYGYGVASLRHTLSKDPTQYEDVNPLLNKGVGPTQEQIDEATAALASPPATDQPSPDGIGAFLPVIIGIGVGVVLIVVGVVVTVVLVRRSNRSRSTNP
ncbi:S8/S53 family peptidase [Microbacterium sp. Clip185]|uniref:S8/S53 family peptidase n=1 Tax=Microbacterium sp. Clip185 TaxID=3025663 RepID=UPI002366D3C7|nr:S8/S53 family peptidase [Microbacterium sp. Clip185]WDG18504.1 S8/S53 family peptidase [Microbacterium sp. Clip185]